MIPLKLESSFLVSIPVAICQYASHGPRFSTKKILYILAAEVTIVSALLGGCLPQYVCSLVGALVVVSAPAQGPVTSGPLDVLFIHRKDPVAARTHLEALLRIPKPSPSGGLAGVSGVSVLSTTSSRRAGRA